MIKSILLIDQLIKSGYKENIDLYSSLFKLSLIDYLSSLFEISEKKGIISMNGCEIPLFFVNVTGDNQEFLNHLNLHLNNIKSEAKFKINFYALKKYPLLKHGENTYIILSRKFLKNQIYYGFIFDIFNRSGLNTKFKSFSDYKSFIGKSVMEERLFRSILKFTFREKHHILVFSDLESAPDAYLRISNRIFLFEFKDYLMASNVIDSMDAEHFKEELDLKFIKNQQGKPKGISQIINQIIFLSDNEFKFDIFTKKNITRNKIEIYPVILYTDMQYSVPGINTYLSSKFDEILHSKNISKFKKICKPIMISLNYMFENMELISNNRFDKIISDHNKKAMKFYKRSKKTLSPNDWIESQSSIEFLKPSLNKQPVSNNEKLKQYFELLNITFR